MKTILDEMYEDPQQLIDWKMTENHCMTCVYHETNRTKACTHVCADGMLRYLKQPSLNQYTFAEISYAERKLKEGFNWIAKSYGECLAVLFENEPRQIEGVWYSDSGKFETVKLEDYSLFNYLHFSDGAVSLEAIANIS